MSKRHAPGTQTSRSVTLTSYGVQSGGATPSTTPRGVATVGVVTRGVGGAVVNGYGGKGRGGAGGGGGASPGKCKVDLSALYEQRELQ